MRGHGDAAPTRRIALSRSARLDSSPILKSDYRRRSSTPCVRIRGCLRACVRGYTIAVGCPSFTLCQELNTNGRFERSMVEHCSHRPSPRAERGYGFGWFAGRPSNAATQGLGREESGEYGAGTDPKEREWQPYMSIIRLIRMGSSGDNLESVDFSYGRRRTTAFRPLEVPHLSTHRVILPQLVLGGSTHRAVPSAQADNTQLPSGARRVPGRARFASSR